MKGASFTKITIKMNNIDPNKIIKRFSDCQGTCKTPIGCTCGRMKNPSLEEIMMEEKSITRVSTSEATEQGDIVQEEAAATSGGCACKCKSKRNNTSCCQGSHKLEVYNWLGDMPEVLNESKMVEVQFKNTRKGYYINSNNLELFQGDIIAVEASPGHDIGEVTLTGKLVELQMKKTNFRGDIRRVYRIAKQNDLEKYEQAKAKEHKTMLRAREIAEELKLDMKISDVEFQGDGNKAIFYYIADGRVDFRQLIKHYASEFRVKIEMKQIGARQEAGRVGGIGPCGRELCCSSSMSNFVSVSTSAARLQDIPLNPQKLAGQCGKLKCCLNFEVDTYVEAQKKLPHRDTVLETKNSSYYHFKTDILSGTMTYSTDKHFAANLVTLPSDKVFDVIRQNRKGEKPIDLAAHNMVPVEEKQSHDVLEQESITRFDNSGENNGADKNRRDRRNKQKRRSQNGQNNNGNRNNNTINSKKPIKQAAQTEAKSQNTEAPKEQQPQRRNRRKNRPNGNKPNPNSNKNKSEE